MLMIVMLRYIIKILIPYIKTTTVLIQLLRDINKEYGLELVGEDLGNFHIDFSMDKANSEIYAIESLFLGKKTYIDILEPTDKDVKTINSEHIRMK